MTCYDATVMKKSPRLAFARRLRRESTDAETQLWFQLRARRLDGRKFRRQHPIGAFVVDFVCLKSRLVVEVDGDQHANRKSSDDERTRFLEARGYRVLRFWNNEVLETMEGVLTATSGSRGWR